MLKDFDTLCLKLSSTTKRTEKENILKEYKDNQLVKDILYFVFNPYITTGISSKKLQRMKTLTYDKSTPTLYTNICDLINDLKEHNSGSDSDLLVIRNFIETCPEYEDLICKIVSKDLRLGIQSTTLNKIYGKNFVPTFDVMLAQRYFDDPEKLLPENVEFILTTKLDGVRCICMYESESNIKFFSRQGQSIEQLNQLRDEVKKYLHPGYMYDGELLLNKSGLLSKDLYRETVKVTSSDKIKENIVFNIFDMVDINAFKNGQSTIEASTRKEMLNNILCQKLYLPKPNYIKEVEILYRGYDKEQIQYWLDKITSEGGEGVMINISNGYYECKRSKSLLKVKKMQTCDLRCIGVEEGTGHNAGRLGAINVEFTAPDNNKYLVDVGSGFTFEDRDFYWNNKDEIIGKIVEIQYFEITQNQQGGYSLRFPVFKYVRNDKTEESMY